MAGEKATLTARMIDRPVRPLFPKGWHRETQLVCQPISVDHVHPYDILAMNGASAARAASPRFPSPITWGGRGRKLTELRRQPRAETLEDLELDLIVSAPSDPDGQADADGITGRSPRCPDIAHGDQEACGAMEELRQKAGRKDRDRGRGSTRSLRVDPGSHGAKLDEPPRSRGSSSARGDDAVEARWSSAFSARTRRRPRALARSSRLREARRHHPPRIVDKKRPTARRTRSDDRAELTSPLSTARSFTAARRRSSRAASGRPHGHEVDNLGLQETKTFWHHYNFPPFSVGEAGFMRGPKRRDIGHGALAERALVATIPDLEEFPYVTRVVSETLESNGSSSMGSVCASSMALQAAGVPVSAPVAGVAMGLIKEGDDYVVLTDIAGVEDHLGDMDFKVAGTSEGINALQMDIKITGVTFDILRDALSQAKDARMSILGKMSDAIAEPRPELSPFAPRISQIQIDTEKIGAVIGKGGETIRGISEEFEAQIDVEDDGSVRVYAPTGQLVEACVKRIESITKEAEIGDRYEAAKVVKTTNFGAFIELTKGTDGLLHISNVKPGERVGAVEDVLNSGDEIDVTVVEVDKERGRIGRAHERPRRRGQEPRGAGPAGSGEQARAAPAAAIAAAAAA
jgi:polyribonucleotide nucleotidyltransferase